MKKHTFFGFGLVLALSLSSLAPAATQLVWVTDAANKWRVGDAVCVFQNRDAIGCGTVKSFDGANVGVWVNNPKRDLRSPQNLQGLRIVKDYRVPSSTEDVAEKMQTSNVKTINIGLGMSAGTNYYYPWLELQWAFNRNWALGVSPLYASYTRDADEVSAFGTYFTLTYFYTHFAFRGVQFEGGVGFYDIKVKSAGTEEKASPFAAKLTVGWSGKALWDLGLDIGVSAGAQYIFYEPVVIASSFKGILPIASAYVAYNF